jgi:hypothetical protein
VDPLFYCPFDKAKHGEQMHSDLDLSQLNPHARDCVYNLIEKYWSVFNEKGVFIPVKHYKCVIDTGDSPPIAMKKKQYGPKEIPIMQKVIAALKKFGQIH